MHSLYQLTAEEIGISAKTWQYIDGAYSFEEAVALMQKERYDVLPVRENGAFYRFYITRQWNKFLPEYIEIRDATDLPKLQAGTKFLELLDYFDESDHKYALLTKGSEIAGLISSVNFSWPEIYFRLYNVLASFEMKLADWLFRQKEEKEILELLLSGTDNSGNKHVTVGHYLIDERKGEENHLQEYLFLSSLLSLICSMKLFDRLGYSSRGEFERATKYLSDIRNNIAHPVRRMIKKPEDFKRLKVSLNAVQHISIYLNN